ncbi:MAG: hypothetical protein K2F95_03125 [Alistipes sp.]|nr:hypothetical protein [Alistipes sp.]MDE7128712.1 hypothetical protein [Alistipes sp.]
MTTDGRIGDPVAVDNPTESISLPIPPNYTENHCTIVVEMADTDENPAWTKIAETRQEPALTLAAGFYWAKGNVTLKDGRFAIADRQSDPGLLFRHQSIYGVVNEGSTYGGTAYTPEAVTIALTDIPYDIDGADPCRLISDNLRTPSHAEMWYLYDVEDYQTLRSLDGINGMGYLDSDLFLPYCGVLDIITGSISMRSQAGGYWGLGGNINGDGLIYVLNEEYSLLHYDLVGSNMASLRCVKNLRLPEYVSHTPQTVDNNASFKLTINLDHGELTHYRVALEADDGTYTETSAVESNPTVVMTVPENSSKQSREWHIMVDGIDSGAKLVQPGMKDYALYVSHSPQKSGYEAFTLTVVCDSDMASFPVAAKGDDGTEITAYGSGENPRVELTIPENSDKERTFSIWVNGIDTGRSVVQEACPDKSGFSVEWSSGYLTIVDGEYTFAAEKERGMYFKWHSKYGVAVDGAVTSKTKYEGVVYAPERQEIAAWDDVPYGDVDPCSLVAPAGTWYMPTLDQLKELTADGAKDWEKEVFRMCSDGSQQVYMATSGQLYKDGSKTMLPTIISIWSSEESASKAGQYCYMSWSTATTSNNPVLSTGGVVPNTAMMVRCVRNK